MVMRGEACKEHSGRRAHVNRRAPCVRDDAVHSAASRICRSAVSADGLATGPEPTSRTSSHVQRASVIAVITVAVWACVVVDEIHSTTLQSVVVSGRPGHWARAEVDDVVSMRASSWWVRRHCGRRLRVACVALILSARRCLKEKKRDDAPARRVVDAPSRRLSPPPRWGYRLVVGVAAPSASLTSPSSSSLSGGCWVSNARDQGSSKRRPRKHAC
jgi:hypothetical protein